MTDVISITQDTIQNQIYTIRGNQVIMDADSNENYKKYQQVIQQHCARLGISNTDNFNFRLKLEDNIEMIPQGGIGVTDLAEFY